MRRRFKAVNGVQEWITANVGGKMRPMKRLCAAQVWRHLDYDGRWYDAAHPRVVEIVTLLGVLNVMAGKEDSC